LTQKLKLRDLIERVSFKLTHSKYATYADPEYLMYYREQLEDAGAYLRLERKNMSVEDDLDEGAHCNERGSHSRGVSNQSKIAARKTLLNEELAAIIGLCHDLGHLCHAHEGEHNISEYLEKEGICFLHHSSLSELMLLQEQIHEKTVQRLKDEYERKGLKVPKYKLKLWNKTAIDIMDGARCHCGEGTKYDLQTDRTKDNEKEQKEFLESFTKRGANRKSVARTPEGLLVLICDLIDYIPKDHKDGLIRGIIDSNDPDYEEILMKLGITNEELRNWTEQGGKKNKIMYKVKKVFNDALAKASFGRDGISMDDKIAELMFAYRELNYNKAVIPAQQQSAEFLKDAKHQLIDLYSKALVKIEHMGLEENEVLTPTMIKMIHHMRKKQPEKVKKFYAQMVEAGINESLKEEVDEIISNKTKNEHEVELRKTVRRERLKQIVQEMENEGMDINTEEFRELVIKKAKGEINQTPAGSRRQFVKKMVDTYCEENNIVSGKQLTQEDNDKITEMCNENEKFRLKTLSECICEAKVAIYLGQSTNYHIWSLLRQEKLLTDEQYENRNKRTGNITESMKKLKQMQKEEKKETENKKQCSEPNFGSDERG